MSRVELEQEAMQLSERDRELLAVALVNTLACPEEDLSDELILGRDVELENDVVQEVSHDEMMRRIQASRST